MVTAEGFMIYEDVRVSGVTNMFDVRTVQSISGLSRATIVDIMNNYSEYRKKYLESPEDDES